MARTVIKSLPNLKHFSDGAIKLSGGRLSYPHFDKPYSGENSSDGDGKYSTRYLMPKETHTPEAEYLYEIARKTAQQANKLVVAKTNYFIKDGDDSGKPEEAGMWIVNASENDQPVARDASAEKITDPKLIAKLFAGGNFASLFIRPWPQNNSWGKKINANLIAGQYIKKGDPFGEGRIDDEDVFDAEENSDADAFEEEDDNGGI